MRLRNVITLLAALLAAVPSVCALEAGHFAAYSKLSAGHWVKVSVEDEGMYEITASELAAMGFSDPSKVRVFGYGGNILPESLEDVTVDDIAQVPAIYAAGKVCFYAMGVLKCDPYFSSTHNFLRYTTNTYSSHAYYFLTDDAAYEAMLPVEASQPATTSMSVSTSFNALHHELDLTTPSSSGKNLLGESFGSDYSLHIPVRLPGLAPGGKVAVYTTIGVHSTERTTMEASLGEQMLTFAVNSNRVSAATSDYTFYNIAQARGTVDSVSAGSDELTYSMRLSSSGEITTALLDNFTITYEQHNNLPAHSSQMHMFYFAQQSSTIAVAGLSAEAQVWNVTSHLAPERCALTAATDGHTFKSALRTPCEHFVVFDPTRTLHKVSGFATVGNQNLHALATPHMVIVTTPGLRGQAQRIADYHATADGMDVAVVEQEMIFNEFSSGAADATALRMFMKMLHQRNPEKLKYLLIFGGGTFDNRHMLGNKSDDLVITYQSSNSNIETKSYTTDDYFAMLSDGTGYAIASAPLSIAVGRMPVKNVDEARQCVDKLLRYVADDFGDWRGKALIVSDQGDNDMHVYQAEGVCEIMKDTDIKLNVSKLIANSYPNQGTFATDFRNKWVKMIKEGQVFMAFIGHGGSNSFGKEATLWVIQDSKNMENAHLPFMSLATCNAAPFDSDLRGVGEELFHNPQGGMIAGMVSTRTVFAAENDELNRAMVTALLSLDENGQQRTIGEAIRLAKNSYGSYENINKLNFALLGDPALRLHMPHNAIEITRVNGVDVATEAATISPLTKVKVSGRILAADASATNTAFNGKVTLTLYDKSRLNRSVAMGTSKPVLESYFHREVLAKTDCDATAGIFEATIVVPRECLAQNEGVKLGAFAVSSDALTVVNGSCENVVLAPYDASVAITDTEAPVVEKMYLGDEGGNGDVAIVGTSTTLHATITDDVAVCVRSLSFGDAIEVALDGGAVTYASARCVATIADEGRTAVLHLPVADLNYGFHTMTLAVSDLAGNRTTRSIDFVVENAANVAEISAGTKEARDDATFAISHTLGDEAEVLVVVTDAMHRTVWSCVTTAGECEWQLTDGEGRRVAPGRYTYYCQVRSATGYAASAPSHIVVLAK